jgi:ribosome-binding factor A
VGDLLRQEIADIIMRRLKDPRIGFITVTGVDLSDDLKIARVYISCLKEEEKEATLDVLNAARSFVRSEVGKRIRMKVLPSIEFRFDESLGYGDRIDKLLKEIKGAS